VSSITSDEEQFLITFTAASQSAAASMQFVASAVPEPASLTLARQRARRWVGSAGAGANLCKKIRHLGSVAAPPEAPPSFWQQLLAIGAQQPRTCRLEGISRIGFTLG
jgi:hypothetical protein